MESQLPVFVSSVISAQLHSLISEHVTYSCTSLEALTLKVFSWETCQEGGLELITECYAQCCTPIRPPLPPAHTHTCCPDCNILDITK